MLWDGIAGNTNGDPDPSSPPCLRMWPDQGPGIQAYPPHANVVDMAKPPCLANGDPFATRVRETRGGETREIKPNPATTAPYSGNKP